MYFITQRKGMKMLTLRVAIVMIFIALQMIELEKMVSEFAVYYMFLSAGLAQHSSLL